MFQLVTDWHVSRSEGDLTLMSSEYSEDVVLDHPVIVMRSVKHGYLFSENGHLLPKYGHLFPKYGHLLILRVLTSH